MTTVIQIRSLDPSLSVSTTSGFIFDAFADQSWSVLTTGGANAFAVLGVDPTIVNYTPVDGATSYTFTGSFPARIDPAQEFDTDDIDAWHAAAADSRLSEFLYHDISTGTLTQSVEFQFAEDVDLSIGLLEFFNFGDILDQINGQSGEGVEIRLTLPDMDRAATVEIAGSAYGDSLYGSQNNDTLDAGDGDDFIKGGAGHDKLFGRAGNDTLLGNNGRDKLHGDGGQDLLFGAAGNDKLYGGAGIDVLRGNAGKDLLKGGGGTDVLRGGAGGDSVDGGAGHDSLWLDAGHDFGKGGAGNDTIKGAKGNDSLWGEKGNDVLDGGTANDSLVGMSGNDTLLGGKGSDTLFGGAGNDRLDAGHGEDTLGGGDGDDVFVFSTFWGQDTVLDYELGVDMLRIDDLATDGITDQDALVEAYGGVNAQGDVVFDLGNGNIITLLGVTEAALDVIAEDIVIF